MTQYPMSAEQESIWLNEQFDDGASRYVETWSYRFTGYLDTAAVAAALDGILARHEPLRSRLLLVDGSPVQQVMPAMPAPLDIREVAEAELPQALVQAAAPAIPLDTAPLLRASLLRLSDTDSVLVVAVHHAVVDGWCFRLLDEEFTQLCTAHIEDRAPELPELPIAFGEYARRQPKADEATTAYWRELMAGAPEESAFPTDMPRPVVLSHRGGQVQLDIPSARLAAIRALCKSAKVTPFVALATAVNLLVARLSGQDDTVIGTPISRRDDPRLLDLIACLTDVMPLRQRIGPQSTFRELLAQAKQGVRGAMRHKTAPSSQLVRQQNLQRSRSRFPLFQVVLTVDDSDSTGLSLPGVTAERVYIHGGTAKFDVFFHLVPHRGGIRVLLEYSADLFTEPGARRLADHFGQLLAQAVDHPDSPVWQLPLMSDTEQAAVIALGTGDTAEPGLVLAHQAFADTARATPDAVAVRHGDQELTYAQLAAAARRVAAALVAGGHSDARIGICLPRSIDAVAAVLGVMMAGAAAVPLDPAYPAKRLAFIAADADCPVVLTTKDLADALPAATPLWFMDDLPFGEEVALPQPKPSDVSYVIYTSGSTGTPKGVAVPHRTLANLIAWQLERSDAGSGATAQFAPLSFDVAFQELFSTWAGGGTLVLLDEADRRDPGRLLDLLERHQVNRLFLPYAALQQLAEYAAEYRTHCPALTEVISAGEQLFVTPAIRAFFAANPQASLENQYGPSETHVVTAHRLTGEAADWPDRPAIGRPTPGSQVYILDEHLTPRPTGATGEICIGGDSLALGYLNQPELSAEHFVDNPFGGSANLYRSGDLGRLLPTGDIEFLGRQDNQVKVRGYRVELGEIESAIKAVPGVADAVVAVETVSNAWDKRLVAFYTPAGDGIDAKTLRRRVGQALPQYLVPSVCVKVEAFPLTASGKIDRSALLARRGTAGGAKTLGRCLGRAAPQDPAGNPVAALPSTVIGRTGESALPGTADADSPPTTPNQHRIAELWTELLGEPHVGLDDDFFALGGDSLSAVRLLVRIRQIWGVRLSLDAVFAAPTVARLAELVDTDPTTDTDLDLAAELRLDPAIIPATAIDLVEPAAILLTGATGFLGAFLLADLLNQTTATVYCLVRAADQDQAARRLRDAMRGYGLWDPAQESRIKAIPGDLARPGLGLDTATSDFLASTCDAVYHVGASVNLAHSYAHLKDANVSGTVEVLRIAARERTVPVHHVSTVGVYSGQTGHIRPQDPIGDGSRLRNGYAQSKWAAETMIAQARQRGLPVSIYRPTRISGDTAGARGQAHDFLWLLLKGCIQAQAAPADLHDGFDLVPVDHVSGAITALARDFALLGRDWHLSSQRILSFSEAVSRLRDAGYRLEPVATAQWLSRLEADPDNAAYPLLSLLSDETSKDAPATVFDSTETAAELADCGVPAAEVDEKLFARYIKSFIDSGYFPPPS